MAGASGLVGSRILQRLLEEESVAEVHALFRRPAEFTHPKLTVHVVDFNALPPMPQTDEVYLALGTTIRQAGSQAAFRAVDFTATLAVATAAMQAGASRIGVVSAMQANAHSRIFYNRVKGEMEEALRALNPQTLVVARPSVLTGDRHVLQQPARYAERIGILLGKVLAPLLPANYRPIEADCVANALTTLLPNEQGMRIVESGELQRFAKKRHRT
ncbi:NAD(P)H-binding protein [uncultured Oxalicibacterium sp.]|uniref:NAD(P)H-binding protein n=1 Tax=uncultured Oxalicibacterium sp. TaxID=1168540 RepID=UPI003454B4B8